MANLSYLDLYHILATITRAYPSPQYNAAGFPLYPQPQTFAVISQPADLNTDNFAKNQIYKEKSFFFNRSAAKSITIGYPAILLIQRDGLINIDTGSTDTEFDLLFLDLQGQVINGNETYSKGDVLNQRTHEEIVNNLFTIANDFFKELNQFIYAEVKFSPTDTRTGWYSEPYLEQLKTSGDILNYRKKADMAGYFLNRAQILSGVQLKQKESSANQTIGVVTEMKIRIKQCRERRNFNYKEIAKSNNATICCNQ